jgi:hypothetical protein
MVEAEAEAEVDEEEVEECEVEEEVEECEVELGEVEEAEVEEEVEECEVELVEVEEVEVEDEVVECKLEELEVEVVELLELLLEALTVLLKSYKSSLFGPPQNSDWLPLQGILHNAKPSGAGPPPLEKTLPQSILRIIKRWIAWADAWGGEKHTALCGVFNSSENKSRCLAGGCAEINTHIGSSARHSNTSCKCTSTRVTMLMPT